jgi:hypothetical protein
LAVFNAMTITVEVERPLQEVYDFLANPSNFPSWASGVGDAFDHQGGNDWVSVSPRGRMAYRFAERNPYGILDHVLTPESGEPVMVPMRVFANCEGTQIVYTLFQRLGMSDDRLKSDAEWVTSDLMALKSLLESR